MTTTASDVPWSTSPPGSPAGTAPTSTRSKPRSSPRATKNSPPSGATDEAKLKRRKYFAARSRWTRFNSLKKSRTASPAMPSRYDALQPPKKGEFFKFPDGESQVRLVSEPFDMIRHFVQAEQRSYT